MQNDSKTKGKVYTLIGEKGRDGHRTVQGKVEAQVLAKGIPVLFCGKSEFNVAAKCAFFFLKKNKQLETHLCETYNHNYLSGKKFTNWEVVFPLHREVVSRNSVATSALVGHL